MVSLQNSGGGGCRGSQDLTKGAWGEGVAIIIYFLSDKNIHFLEFLR